MFLPMPRPAPVTRAILFFSVFSHVNKVRHFVTLAQAQCEDRATLTCTPYHDSSKRNVQTRATAYTKVTIANAGICSRREAERIIENGNVRVNGKVAQLGDKATLEDTIFVNNKPILHKEERLITLIMNKPSSGVYFCTNSGCSRRSHCFRPTAA